MNFDEAVAGIQKLNNQYDLDLIAIQVILLELLKRTASAQSVINDLPSPEKKGKKK